MTAAANELHISQPTLSVQMKQLEDTLGKKVFQKQGRNLVLTEEGVLLRKRAEDILSLVDKTMQEFQDMDNLIGGEIRFGCAETYLVHHIATVFLRVTTTVSVTSFSTLPAAIPSRLLSALSEAYWTSP